MRLGEEYFSPSLFPLRFQFLCLLFNRHRHLGPCVGVKLMQVGFKLLKPRFTEASLELGDAGYQREIKFVMLPLIFLAASLGRQRYYPKGWLL